MRTIIFSLLVALSWPLATAQAADTCQPPRMLIVLDRSSSMITGMVGDQTKWAVAKTALAAVVNAYQTEIQFGLMVFPNPNECGPGAIKVPIGPSSAQAIMKELETPPPDKGNWTPMSQTLEAVAEIQTLKDKSGKNNVLLITDGWQWCYPYDDSTRFHPVDAADKLTKLGIRTYVVGFGESVDPLTLNRMADKANTKVSSSCDVNGADAAAKNNCYYQANDLTGLQAALDKIAQLVSSPEQCDGLDNNCNGTVDENLTRSCSNACGNGQETCNMGKWEGCTAPKPEAELCDGKDNNCDGKIDEALTRPCQNECGAGVEVCENGQWEGCSAPTQSDELCDGKDNDCDGQIDGPNALCDNGGICVDGMCVEWSDQGCDCSIPELPAPPSALIFLALLAGLVLVARRRS